MSKLLEQAKTLIVVLGTLLLLLVATVDHLTGLQVSVLLFYLIPIALVTWFTGREAGIALSISSAVARFIVEWSIGRIYEHPVIPYSNVATELIFFLIFTSMILSIKRQLEEERRLSRMDSLTVISNSRSFAESAAVEIERARRYKRPLSVLYLDLDNFKSVNDQLGHSIGDELLRSVALTLRSSVRQIDIVARLGGDEFALLLPETEKDGVQIVLRRLQDKLAEAMRENGWPVTFSIGSVSFNMPPNSVDELLRKADEIMYQAKKKGKNQFEMATVP